MVLLPKVSGCETLDRYEECFTAVGPAVVTATSDCSTSSGTESCR